jgi:apolipoprotein N-acyltransferase
MRGRALRSFVPIALGCALASMSGVFLTLCFAPYDAWPLVWVGFVPMAVAQHRVLPPRWSAAAPAIGVAGFVAGNFGVDFFPPASPWYLKLLPLLVGGLVFVVSRTERGRHERTGYAGWPLQAAISWVAIELFRMFVPGLATWGFLGHAMYRQNWFLQPVSVFGIFGLDLLIVFANYALAQLLVAWIDRRRGNAGSGAVPLARAARWWAGALVAIASWSAVSFAMRGQDGIRVRIAALQPGSRPHQLGATPEERDRGMLEILSEQTRRASSQGARLVVWPEAALAADPALAYHDELANLARNTGAWLFVAYRVKTPAGQRNEVVTITPDGAFAGKYGKDHPVRFLGETSLSGGSYPTYQTPFGTVGAMICYDMDFTDSARQLALRGTQVIAVPSADWQAIGANHYVHAVFRALETGAALAKSEFSRDSAIIDGSGAIVASRVTPLGSAAILVADVALHSGVPFAARFGDWVGWLCVAGLAAQLLARLSVWGRRKIIASGVRAARLN